MNERELGRLLDGVVPHLRSPQDRLAAVGRRVRRRRLAVVVAALAAGVLLAGLPVLRAGSVPPDPGGLGDGVWETPGCASYRVAPVTSVGGTPQVGNADDIEELNNRLWPYATEHFADVFAETEVRTDVGRLRAYRKPSPAFDAWVLREFADDCLEVADARASAAEMAAWADRISRDTGYWSTRGIEVTSVGGSPVTGVVEVGVRGQDVAAARQEMPQRYPDIQIIVVSE